MPAAHDDRPRVAHHPPLAGELALDRGHHLLARAGVAGEHRQPAALDHVERERQVVAHDRVDDEVGLAAGGVDGAVAAGDRAHPRLERAQRHLIAPVQALLVGPALVDAADLAAHVADRGSANGATSARERARAPSSRWRPRRRRSRPRARSTAASWARILPPRGSSSTRSAPAARARWRGGVRRTVAGHDQLEPLARVVERAQVGDARRRSRPARRRRRRSPKPTAGATAAGAPGPARADPRRGTHAGEHREQARGSRRGCRAAAPARARR